MKLGRTLVPILKPLLFAATCREAAAGPPARALSRILLVLPMKGIGDIILSLPAVRSLREAHPEAVVDALVRSRPAGELVACYFPVDRIHQWHPGRSGRLSGWAGLVRRLRKQHYDAVVDFMCDHTVSSAFLSFVAGSPRTAGFSCSRRELFFNMPVAPDPHGSHMVDDWNRLVGLFGAGERITRPSIALDGAQAAYASTFLERAGIREDELLVSVHPGARDDLERVEKRWPWKRYGDLCRRLTEEPGVRVVIHGAPAEVELCGRVARRAGGGAVTACGETGVMELLAIIGVSDLFIGNNSGPLHAACALDVPTISFSGGVNMVRWGPVGPGERNRIMTPDPRCRLDRCRVCAGKGLACLERIDVEAVAREARALLGERAGGGRRAVLKNRPG